MFNSLPPPPTPPPAQDLDLSLLLPTLRSSASDEPPLTVKKVISRSLFQPRASFKRTLAFVTTFMVVADPIIVNSLPRSSPPLLVWAVSLSPFLPILLSQTAPSLLPSLFSSISLRSPPTRSRICIHEAGHAVLSHLLGYPSSASISSTSPAVAITPKSSATSLSSALGFSAPPPAPDDGPSRPLPVEEVRSLALISVAGLAAELVFHPSPSFSSLGAYDDLRQLQGFYENSNPALKKQEQERTTAAAVKAAITTVKLHCGLVEALAAELERTERVDDVGEFVRAFVEGGGEVAGSIRERVDSGAPSPLATLVDSARSKIVGDDPLYIALFLAGSFALYAAFNPSF
ncbi:hypothetical protein TeGR_g8556 [Tetraparma gracilis]|uniref:Peptidase M41 domain-containing protein n=1 Tax=Tetraparma gracilis TaxID=2962635 RepID=A0ABQ6N5I5_9STRA|nr:hypothetical protein TeGR_g8556 [Tetraparma gracilis]